MGRGQLRRLFIGNMFSNKTGLLITEIETLRKYGGKRVLVFKPITDTRSGQGRLRARDGREISAHEVTTKNPWEVLNILRAEESVSGIKFEILAFDEINFFPANSGFYELVSELLNRGYDVIAAGLPVDFRGQPFGSTLLLTWFGQGNCLWLDAYCTKCGEPASFVQRILPDGSPAPYDGPQVMVGDKEIYEPRCDRHFILPGKPTLILY